jgi:hypothetical protein
LRDNLREELARIPHQTNVKCPAREWSEWDERHGRLSREVAIIRRRDGSGKLCVFAFHIGASKDEISLRPAAPRDQMR